MTVNNRSIYLRLIIGCVALLCVLQPMVLKAQQMTATDVNVAPIIQLLLDGERRFVLDIGQPFNRRLDSESFENGVEFIFRSVRSDFRLEIQGASIDPSNPPSLFIDGISVGAITNGRNVFNIKSDRVTSRSVFRIGYANGESGDWVVETIRAVLSEGPASLEEAQRFLMRSTFGPNQQELNRVLSIGYSAWVDEQINLPATLTVPLWHQYTADRIAARRQDYIDAGVTDPIALDSPVLGATSRFQTRMDTWWQATLKGNDQLRQRVAYAYSQIFNVTESNPNLIPYFHDTLVRNAFGNYYDLLREVSLTPMMGGYLGMLGNVRASGGNFPTVPDENFAREIMQLFSIGLIELNVDGTPKLSDGKIVDTYSQATIKNFARVFTGWTSNPEGFRPGWEFNPMKVDSRTLQPGNIDKHDTGAKTLLNGHVNPAGLSTEEDFNRAIRNIVDHPNVGPFIGRQLIQRLVKSNPSSEYIERVAGVFNNNGRGIRGDMGAVVKAILLDEEALQGHVDPEGGKLKEPLLAVTQLWRALGATSAINYFRYTQPIRDFGQGPYNAPTVFGFYEPDYAPQGDIETQGLVAPEFNLLTDNAVRSSLSRMYELISGERYGETFTSTVRQNDGQNITVNHTRFNGSLSATVNLNLSQLTGIASSTEALVDRLDTLFLGGLMSNPLRSAMLRHIDALPVSVNITAAQREQRVREALALLVVSPEYHTQR